MTMATMTTILTMIEKESSIYNNKVLDMRDIEDRRDRQMDKWIITRLSIAFEDLLGSSIAPQVMPHWIVVELTMNMAEYANNV